MSRRTILMAESRSPSQPLSKLWWLVALLLLLLMLPDFGWRHPIIDGLKNAIGAFDNGGTAGATVLPPYRESSASPPQLEMPIDADNRCMVELTLNGVGPFRFIVDTGSPGVILTAAMGVRLGIDLRKLAPDHDSGGWGGGSTNGVFVHLKEMKLKNFRLQNFAVAVENEKKFQEGLLGITFLNQLRRFDMRDGQCRFWW